jgi:hypothetical protein
MLDKVGVTVERIGDSTGALDMLSRRVKHRQ